MYTFLVLFMYTLITMNTISLPLYQHGYFAHKSPSTCNKPRIYESIDNCLDILNGYRTCDLQPRRGHAKEQLVQLHVRGPDEH